MDIITGQINVYLSPYSNLSMNDYDKAKDVAQFLFFKDKPTGEYTLVGKADISITFSPRADIVANKVDVLRTELQTVRAKAQLKANEIEQQIQNLLAITNEVSA